MPRPWRLRYVGARYHLTGRGNGRETIFHDSADYARFLAQLDAAAAADAVVLYAYVLMPNHYHLFVETPQGNVQRFMQRLNTAYSMYFRFRHRRPGHCFQGRYGAKVVSGDAYILGLTRYIHLNPVKGESVQALPAERKRDMLRAFAYSSYRGYAGWAAPEPRIDYRWLRLMGRRTDGGRRQAYGRFVEAMLVQDDALFLRESARSRYAIGDERFREEAEQELKDLRLERAVSGDILWPEHRRPDVETVAEAAAEVLQIRVADARFHGHRLGLRKYLLVEWCCRLSGASQRAVGEHLRYGSESAVGKARKKAQAALVSDPALAAKEREVQKRLLSALRQGPGKR